MNQINLIRQTLRPHLSWHGARVTFLALFLVALVRVRTVNFSEVAQGFMGNAKAESSEKRLHRFFSEFDIDYPEIACLVAGLMEISQPWVLSVDPKYRTKKVSLSETRFQRNRGLGKCGVGGLIQPERYA
jgi:hypothetical protein